MEIQTINEFFNFRRKNKVIKCTDNNIKSIVDKEIKRLGNDADLNHLDVSHVTDMGKLFYQSKFNGDISKWDVSNVKDMRFMFYESAFNGDVSNWDVSNVEDMNSMFAYSEFNGDISKWDVSNVEYMAWMFYKSEFNQNISNWKITPKCDCTGMFKYCPIKQEYKPKIS